MDIVKKNILSILCGVVALIGVIVWFFPIGGMYNELKAQVEASAAKYDETEALRKATRRLPTLDLEGNEAPPLGRFPNEKTIEVGREATEAMAGQSKKMLTTVSEKNVRQLLTPDSLPKPAEKARLDFTYEYYDVLGLGDSLWQVGLPAALKATLPPTPQQIEQRAEKLWAEKYAVQVVEIGGQDNLPLVTDQFLAEAKLLPNKVREEAALGHMIYLNYDALPVHPEIVPGRNPKVEDIWYAQTALWITEDVVRSIAEANSGAKNITDAPVKHLISMDLKFDQGQYVTVGGKPSGGEDGGGAAIPVDGNGAPAVWSASPTGRVCNELYDVIHFSLVLRTDARKVPQVIATLERDKLVTVLQANITPVDAAAARKVEGFVYGNDPVVTLELKCEALFLRSWTINEPQEGRAPPMPDEVQILLGAKAKPAGESAE
jgi:hypothetical protein